MKRFKNALLKIFRPAEPHNLPGVRPVAGRQARVEAEWTDDELHPASHGPDISTQGQDIRRAWHARRKTETAVRGKGTFKTLIGSVIHVEKSDV